MRGRQRHDVRLLQVHAFGWPAAGSERVVSVLSSDVLLLHWTGAAGRGFVRAGAARVLFWRLCAHRITNIIQVSRQLGPHLTEVVSLNVRTHTFSPLSWHQFQNHCHWPALLLQSHHYCKTKNINYTKHTSV